MEYTEVYMIVPQLKGLVAGFPLGINSICNYLEKELPGMPIKVLDLSAADDDKVRTEVSRIPKDALVGISTVTASYRSALKIAELASRNGCSTILGGPHPAKQSEVILQSHSCIDYIAIGDGERTMHGLLVSKEGLEDVPGLAYRSSQGIFRNKEYRVDSEELSSIPFRISEALLASSSMLKGKLEERLGRSIVYSASKGCTKSCSFCAAAGRYVSKSAQSIIQDIRYLVDAGYNRINFEDNYFGSDSKDAMTLCDEIIGHRLNISWDCQTRVDISDSLVLLAKMKAAGCDTIFLGVENLDRDVLKYLNKTDDAEAYVKKTEVSINKCYELGISPQIMFQIGLEIEDDQIRESNLDALEMLGMIAAQYGKELDVYTMVSVAYPGTPLFRRYKKQHHLSEDIFEHYSRWEEENRDLFISNNCPHGIGGIQIGLMDSSKLSQGIFEIDDERYSRMLEYRSDISRLDGIRVHGISDYTVK